MVEPVNLQSNEMEQLQAETDSQSTEQSNPEVTEVTFAESQDLVTMTVNAEEEEFLTENYDVSDDEGKVTLKLPKFNMTVNNNAAVLTMSSGQQTNFQLQELARR